MIDRARTDAVSRSIGLLLLGLTLGGAIGIAWITSALRTPAEPIAIPAVAGWQCEDVLPSTRPVDTSTAALATCPLALDGMVVRLTGEAIGDVLGRQERRWVQLNDDPYSIVGQLQVHHGTLGTSSGAAILLPAGVRPQWLGGPGVTGDLLEVTGVFKASAPEDQGGAVVVATQVRTVRDGRATTIPVDRRLVVVAVVMSFAAAALWSEALRHRRRW